MLPKTGNVQWPKFHVKKAPFYAGYAAEVQYATRITITTPQSVKLAALRSFTMLRTGVGTPRFFSEIFSYFSSVSTVSYSFRKCTGFHLLFLVFLYFCRYGVYFTATVQCSILQYSAAQKLQYRTAQYRCSAVGYDTIQKQHSCYECLSLSTFESEFRRNTQTDTNTSSYGPFLVPKRPFCIAWWYRKWISSAFGHY